MASRPSDPPPSRPGAPRGSPYRDERESLLGEIESLRARLRARRGPRLGLILGGLVLHLLLRTLLSGWLNGHDDARFGAALLLSTAPLLLSLVLLARAATSKRG